MILHRCFAWNTDAGPADADGPLWCPRAFQGEGRHDNPDLYGCLYLSRTALSTVVEQLARFRGQRFVPSLLKRRGLPLALSELELDDRTPILDLDDPVVVRRERLRPSIVATRHRDVTQPQARQLYERHQDAGGLTWWSTYEAQWANVTLFDRAVASLHVRSTRVLTLEDPVAVEAADFFGLRRMPS